MFDTHDNVVTEHAYDKRGVLELHNFGRAEAGAEEVNHSHELATQVAFLIHRHLRKRPCIMSHVVHVQL